jgi:predicted peptidase
MMRLLALLHATASAFPTLGTTVPLGERTKMSWDPPQNGDDGVEHFQLFLPRRWAKEGSWPMLIFLHGAGDGVWDVMNSQSLPCLLSRDQSTAFATRKSWTFEFDGQTYANASFADELGFVVVMPQGWGATMRPGWSRPRLERVRALATRVASAYAVDPERISLAGQSAGGVGAWRFALEYPEFLSVVVPICGALPGDGDRAAQRLKDLSVWVFHAADDVAMPVSLGDDAVAAVNRAARREPARYTRYRHAPPPDPQYNDMIGHASYDLAFRDASLYAWLAVQRRGAS